MIHLSRICLSTLNMATHKRSRTGCWTCREAGYKCDEKRPFCGRCTRLNIICKGYGVKLKWQNNASNPPRRPPGRSRQSKPTRTGEEAFAPHSASTSSSSYICVGNSLHTTSPASTIHSMLLTPIKMSMPPSDLSYNHGWLLHYWITHLSSLIFIASRKALTSPLQVHLTSMVYNSAALRSTVLSMAANHLAQASNDPSLSVRAYVYEQKAINELQKYLQDSSKLAYEPALATVLMMQISARLFSKDDEVTIANHLAGAKAIVRQHREREQETSRNEQFLLSLFAYHDILSSVSRVSQPMQDHSTSFTAVEGEEELRSVANILLVVAQISELQHAIKSRRSQGGNVALSESEDATGRRIQQSLLSMKLNATKQGESVEEMDIRCTAQAYCHAAFIYLYRTWLDIGGPNPISMDHIHSCLERLEQVGVQSPLSAAHLWPLFTAGCEAIDGSERQFVRTRLSEMYTVKQFPSLRRVMRDIEDVWAAKDSEHERQGREGMAKVDCIQVILRRGGREVDLA